MNILVCTTEYYPHGSGIANVAYNIVNELEKQGINCTICSPTGPDIFLGSRSLILKFGRLGLLYYWFKVSKHLKKSANFDAVWLHQPLFILETPFSKSISTVHITASGHFKATKRLGYSSFLKSYIFISSIIEKQSLRKIKADTKFITDSPTISQELTEIVGHDTPPDYIPNGVNTSMFAPVNNKIATRNKFDIPPESTIFITIGRLSPQKKLHLMIDIFEEISNYVKNSYLIIGGKGELEPNLRNYISEKQKKNVRLVGFVPDKDLPELYACSDYYIMTSEYEGQPLTLLEAMASGLPCIVSNIPNLSIVDEANCGIVIDFSDKEKAISTIIDYVNNDNSVHAINARKYAEENLDWSIIAEKYLQEFKKLKS